MNFEYPYERAEAWRGGVTRNVPSDPSSEACTVLVQQWIRECVDTHPDCLKKSPQSAEKHPKRLLAIGSNSREFICIIETGQMMTTLNQPYVAFPTVGVVPSIWCRRERR
jgi:hypothetical protein